jgi:hypothetical protein
MKLVSVETIRLIEIEKQYIKDLNAENTTQNICILD